jgi:uncharacterized protein YukE
MGQTSGADADALDGLAHEVGELASRLRSAQARLGRAIHSSPWNGRTADRFRQQWDGEYRRSMLGASQFLTSASTELRTHAQQQRDASGVVRRDAPPNNPSWSDRLRRSISQGREEFARRLREWQSGLSSVEAFAATLGIAGVVAALSPGLLVPGLIIGLSLSTGASVPDVLRELGTSTSNVARGENLSTRVKAFVNLCKSVGLPGTKINIGSVIDLAVITWDTGDLAVDVIRYGPESDVVQQEKDRLYFNSLDFGSGILIPKPPVEVPLNTVDLIFETGYNDKWESVTKPSGIRDRLVGETRPPAVGGGGGGGW